MDIKAGQIWQNANSELYHVIAVAYCQFSSIPHSDVVVYFQPGNKRVWGCSVPDWRSVFKIVSDPYSV